MLKLAFSNRMDTLARLLSEFIRIASSYHLPESAHTLIVPSACAEYLRIQIGQHLGVCANIGCEESVRAFFEHLVLRDEGRRENNSRVLLTQARAFSAIYRDFCENHPSMDKALAVSRARTMAENLVRCAYESPDGLQGALSDPYELRPVLEIVRERFRAIHQEIELPFQWIASSKIDTLDIPGFLFIYDSGPLSAFEVAFLRHIIHREPRTYVFACIFSPCRGYWYNCECNVKFGREFYADKEKTPTIIRRCGRVSQRTGEAWLSLVNYDDDAAITHYHDDKAPYETEERYEEELSYYLSYYQSQVLAFDSDAQSSDAQSSDDKPMEFRPLDDDSIVFRLYDSPREEVCDLADDLVRIASEEDGDFLFDDIAVLVPESCAENYASLIRCEFEKRGIPYNVRGILSHPLSIGYSAFEAFARFLMSDAAREDVIRFAFHEGGVDDDSLRDANLFVEAIDQLGIYGGFETPSSPYLHGTDLFTWKQGMKRLAAMMTEGGDTLLCTEPAVFDPTTLHTLLAHFCRVHAMLTDHEIIRSQNLTFGQWRHLLFSTFDGWLDAGVAYRDQTLSCLFSLFDRQWPIDLDENGRYPFEDVEPILRSVLRRLGRFDATQMFGGVQVRLLSESVYTARRVYMVGQSSENVPSTGQRPTASCSRAEAEAHAWLKWVNNASQKLVITASVAPDNPPNVSLFALDLSRDVQVDLSQARVAARDGGRAEYLASLCEIRQRFDGVWPTSMASFSGSDRTRMIDMLDAGFRDTAASSVVGLRTLHWKALAKVLCAPCAAFRKYRFNIQDYIANNTPQARAQRLAEPVEPDATVYAAKKALQTLLIHSFVCHDLDAFERHFDEYASLLQKMGVYPGGVYAEIVRRRAENACRRLRKDSSRADLSHPVLYNLGKLRDGISGLDAWITRHYPMERQVLEVTLHSACGTDVVLQGALPVVVLMDGSPTFVVDSSLTDKALPRRMQIAALILKCLDMADVPESYISVGEDGSLETKKGSISLPDMNPRVVLEHCLWLFETGKHEIESCEYSSKGGCFKRKPSPLQQYLGDDTCCETESEAFWKSVCEEDEVFRRLVLG